MLFLSWILQWNNASSNSTDAWGGSYCSASSKQHPIGQFAKGAFKDFEDDVDYCAIFYYLLDALLRGSDCTLF
jgi:hypothetical protein